MHVSGPLAVNRLEALAVNRLEGGRAGHWQVTGPPPAPRAYMGFAECGGRLFVFGGYSDALGPGAPPPPSLIFLHNLHSSIRLFLPPLPRSKRQYSALRDFVRCKKTI